MGTKLSERESIKSIDAVVKFNKQHSHDSMRTVTVKAAGKIIFNDSVKVSIFDGNIYYNVNILWEESDTDFDFHSHDLHGYYSTSYFKMRFESNVLIIIDNDNKIEINIL